VSVVDPPLKRGSNVLLVMEQAEKPKGSRGLDAPRPRYRLEQSPGRVSLGDAERRNLDAPSCVPTRRGSAVVVGVLVEYREADGKLVRK
jgi:hypothetical protein